MTLGFFLCSVVWSLLSNVAQSLCLCSVVRIFSCEMFSGGSWTTLHKVFTCAMLSQDYYDNIEQDLFLDNVFWRLLDNIAQCCLEPTGQNCTKFLPVQCCPNSMKTKLNRIFSCVMLSGASWITLHKAQSFYLSNVVPRVLRLQ